MFVDYLEINRIAANPKLDDTKHRYLYAVSAMVGVSALVELAEFQKKPAYANYLFRTWPGIASTLHIFFDDAENAPDGIRATKAITMRVAYFTIDVLTFLMHVDHRTLLEALNNKMSHMLIFSIWLRDWGDENMTVVNECGSLLPFCLTSSGDGKARKHLIQAAKGPAPAEKIAKIAITRLKNSLNGAAPKGSQEECRASFALAMHVFADSDSLQDEVAKAIVKNGGLGPTMHVLVILGNKPIKTERVLFNAAGCFLFVNNAFDHSVGCATKVLRTGLLRVLAQFSPYTEQMETVKNSAVMAMKHTLEMGLPRSLIFPEVIKAFDAAMRNLSEEDRQTIRNSPLGKHWRDVEMLALERLAIFRMEAIQDRMERYDTVRT